MVEESSGEENRHRAASCGHDTICVRGEEIRAVADDKTPSEGEDVSFTAEEIDGVLGFAWVKESGMCAARVDWKGLGVGTAGSARARAEHSGVGVGEGGKEGGEEMCVDMASEIWVGGVEAVTALWEGEEGLGVTGREAARVTD